jgi:hypothetical protein
VSTLPLPIADEALNLDEVPRPDEPWPTIQRFAHTFHAYDRHGSFAACAAIAGARRRESLSDLRTCLFFEVRRWHHFGKDPDERAASYIRSLVADIRAALGERAR